MTELPGTPWRAAIWSAGEALAHAPAQAAWRRTGQVRHVFTHFELLIDLFVARVHDIPAGKGFLLPATSLDGAALPSVMRKCVALARPQQ